MFSLGLALRLVSQEYRHTASNLHPDLAKSSRLADDFKSKLL
jgi:hypothetical protein